MPVLSGFSARSQLPGNQSCSVFALLGLTSPARFRERSVSQARFDVVVRTDTAAEVEYFGLGDILQMMLHPL